jgi:amino acid transporter
MEPWLAALIILGAAAMSAVGMLIVRRRAPTERFFKDPVPLAAVYTVAGTAYMVIVAFVFFIAFESYGGAKNDAEEEATATLAMFHAVGPFDPAARAELQGQMICYAREVISHGWPAMREGGGSSVVDARVSALEESAEQIPVSDAKQAAAFEHWFALNEERRQGRQGRIGEAEGLVPPVIWLILIIGAVVVIASVALFADREEAAVTQAAMAATIAIIVVSGLVLVRFLDRPYEDRSGSIKPTAMARTLALMEREHRESGQAVIRCAELAG